MADAMDVSVIIPTYNRASMVGEAIESALAQTYPVREVIVLDDGSTDDTQRVVRAFGGPVRYVRQDNQGVGAARNAAMALARGAALAFLDSDDVWYPFKLDAQVAVLEALPHVGLVHSEFDILKGDGTKHPQGGRSWFDVRTDPASFYTATGRFCELCAARVAGASDFPVHSGDVYRALLHQMFVLTSTVVVRREALKPEDRFAEAVTIFEDWEFFARVARHHEVAFLDVETASNRSHELPGRITRCGGLDKARSYLSLVERVWKADAEFRRSHEADVRRAEAHGLLALARIAILDNRVDIARGALRRWRELGSDFRSGAARLYSLCAAIPAGGTLLRHVLRLRTLGHLAVGRGHAGYPVNPAP